MQIGPRSSELYNFQKIHLIFKHPVDDTVTSTMSKTMQTIMPTLHELGDCLVGSGFLLFEAVSLSIVFGTSK